MNRICKIIWSLVQNGYVVVFELAKGRGKVAAQKLVRILTGGRAGYDPWRGGLAGLCSNANDAGYVGSDTSHCRTLLLA